MSTNRFDSMSVSRDLTKSRPSGEKANRIQPLDSTEPLPGLVDSVGWNAGIEAGTPAPKNESTRSSGTHLTVSDAKLQDLGPISDLCKAAQANDIQTFRLLLGKGQSLYMVSPRIYNSTPAHWAAYCNSTDILLEIGALVTNDQQLTELFALHDWLNMTVIHMAAYQGHVAALLVLLDQELAGRFTRDVFELKDVWGKTAMDWAIAQGHTAAVEVLVLRKLQQLLPQTVTPAVTNIHDRIRAAQRAGIQSASCIDTDNPEQLDAAVLDVRLLVDLVLVCREAGMNILSVLLVVEDILVIANSYEALVVTVQQLTRDLLDICKTKEEAQTILTPLMDEPRAAIQPAEPIMYGLQRDKKEFIAHTQVQALLTEKFDPFGSFEYSNKPSTFFFWVISATVIYTWWAMYMPAMVLIRPFSKALNAHTQKGKLMVTTRYPWHVPYNKWLAAYITHFIFLAIYTIVATSQTTVRSHPSPLEWVLLAWAVGVLADTVQECVEHYPVIQHGINIFDVTSSTGFILNMVCKYLEQFSDSELRVGMLSAASIFLSIGIFAMYVRSLGVFSVAPGIGPLLVMLRRMIIDDGRKFLVVMFVIFMAFVAALEVLFKPVCRSRQEPCVEYADGWELNWVGRGDLGGSVAYLVYTLYGYGPGPAAWSGRPVAGSVFFTIFMSITSLLLINLFIAMLADTYRDVKLQAAREYKFGRAVLILHISRREAIYPPVNLVHLVAALLGNTLLRFFQAEMPGVQLRKVLPGDATFLWYNPTNEKLLLTRRIRNRIFHLFAKKCAEKYGRSPGAALRNGGGAVPSERVGGCVLSDRAKIGMMCDVRNVDA